MEYQFSQDFQGPEARFSMGHEALGAWLTQDIGGRHDRLAAVFNALDKVQTGNSWEEVIDGFEFRLTLSRDEAQVYAHSLLDEFGDEGLDSDEDAMALYEDESHARCGLEDFASLIADWAEFTGHSA